MNSKIILNLDKQVFLREGEENVTLVYFYIFYYSKSRASVKKQQKNHIVLFIKSGMFRFSAGCSTIFQNFEITDHYVTFANGRNLDFRFKWWCCCFSITLIFLFDAKGFVSFSVSILYSLFFKLPWFVKSMILHLKSYNNLGLTQLLSQFLIIVCFNWLPWIQVQIYLK